MRPCALTVLLAFAATSTGCASRPQQAAKVYRVGALFNRGPNQDDVALLKPIASIDRERSAMSVTFGGETEHQSADDAGYFSQSENSRPSFGNDSGRSTTPLTTEKMAVVAPMPSASVRTTAVVKPTLARIARRALCA